MTRLSALFVIVISILAFSCSKGTSGPNAGHGPNSIFPLVAGDTWYYRDSSFNDSGQVEAGLDTMTVTKQTVTDNTNTVYLGLSNPNGWFQGSYIAVDPSNTAIYEVDSPAYQPYTFFQVVGQDGPVGTGADYSNASCPLHFIQYGYAEPFTIGTYSCLKNAEVTTDCNNVILNEIVSYVSPGVGMVRIEDYLPDSAQSNKLYMDYSQTLSNAVLH